MIIILLCRCKMINICLIIVYLKMRWNSKLLIACFNNMIIPPTKGAYTNDILGIRTLRIKLSRIVSLKLSRISNIIKTESSLTRAKCPCLSCCKAIEKILFIGGIGSMSKIWDFTMEKYSFKPIRNLIAYGKIWFCLAFLMNSQEQCTIQVQLWTYM